VFRTGRAYAARAQCGGAIRVSGSVRVIAGPVFRAMSTAERQSAPVHAEPMSRQAFAIVRDRARGSACDPGQRQRN